jgi:hypothetical protein
VYETLSANYQQLSATADTADQVVQEVVAEYASELDAFVQQANDFLNDIRDGAEFSDYDLQRMVLRLPILLYRLSDGISRSALESDIAKAAAGRVRSDFLLTAEARTAAERSAMADLHTDGAWRLADLAKNVHGRLKAKAEYALGLYEAVKKVMSARDMDKNVFRMEAANGRPKT